MNSPGATEPRPGRIDGPALREMRLQAHHAAQLLTAFAGWALEPREDDAHRSFCWLADEGLLATGSETRERGSRIVRLDLSTLRLSVAQEGASGLQVVAALDLDGRTLAEGHDWLAEQVLGDATTAAELPLPDFSLPAHPVAEGAAFHLDPTAATELRRWFHEAWRVIRRVTDRPDAGAIRCWPHHFDIAALITVSTGDDPLRTVGVGMTPGDESYSAPYGYISPWPAPRGRDLPSLPHGHWHTGEWVGAVLTADEWTALTPEEVASFYSAAIDAAIRLHDPR